MVHSLQLLGMVMNISLLLHMGTYTCFMRNPNHWKYLKSIKLKLKINYIEGLKPLDLIVVVSITTDTTDQVDVKNYLSISERE